VHISDGVLHPIVLGAGFAFSGFATMAALRRVEDRDYPLMGLLAAAFFVAGLIHLKLPPTSVHLTLHVVCGAVLGIKAFPVIFVALLMQAALLGHGGFSTLGVNACIFGFPAWLVGAILRKGLASGRSGWIAFVAVIGLVVAGSGVAVFRLLHIEIGTLSPVLILCVSGAMALIAGALCFGLNRLGGGRIYRLGAAAGGWGMLISSLMLFAVLAFSPLHSDKARDAFETVAYYVFIAHAPIMFVELTVTGFVVTYLAKSHPGLLSVCEKAPISGGSDLAIVKAGAER